MEQHKRKFKWDTDESDDEILVVKKCNPKKTVDNIAVKTAGKTADKTEPNPIGKRLRSSLRSSTVKRSSHESLSSNQDDTSTSVTSVFVGDVKKRRDATTKIRFESCINERTDHAEESVKLPSISLEKVPGLVVKITPATDAESVVGKNFHHRLQEKDNSLSNNPIKLEERTVTLTGEEQDWLTSQMKASTSTI